jgi:hypothetical protein
MLIQGIQPRQHQHQQPQHQHQILHSVSPMLPSKVGKRQTNRQKYTDEEVAQICSMKESGMPWRFVPKDPTNRKQDSCAFPWPIPKVVTSFLLRQLQKT